MASPFDPDNHAGYLRWRDRKRAQAATEMSQLRLDLESAAGLDGAAMECLRQCFARANLALIRLSDDWERSGAGLQRLGQALGLQRLDRNLCADDDAISAIQVTDQRRANEYIPYTDRPLSWHTDGYYNDLDSPVRAVVLHCVRSAAAGGGNALLDPELAYILLRDENPAFITALEHPQCMTIPANAGEDGELRPEVCGPVFSRDPLTGALHMRYSARKKNIRWRDDDLTRAAVAQLTALLDDRDGPVLRYRLQAGEGLISNNVLHNRTAFQDDPDQQRLLYRARYHDRLESDI